MFRESWRCCEILIMLFGIPLGFSGVAVLMGLLAGLASIVAAYYAVAASVLLEGAMFMLMGMIQIVLPQLWDKLMALALYGSTDRLLNCSINFRLPIRD
jgi:hypothetical protein